MIDREFTIPAANGRKIHLSVDAPDFHSAHPTVIICHGFKGFKDWGWFGRLGKRLADAGFAALRFNFSHNGVSGGGTKFDDLEGFRLNSYGIMLDDVRRLIRVVDGLPWVATDQRFLFGHSMGGGVALLAAAHLNLKLRGLVLWNPVGRCDRFSAAAKEELARQGFIEVPNARTGQILRVGQDFFTDLEQYADQRDLAAAIAALDIPVQVVVGSADESVPAAESSALAELARQGTLDVVEGGGHTFNCGHPFHKPSGELEQALQITHAALRRMMEQA